MNEVKIGDKREIKNYNKKPEYWVSKMKKYMGVVVTIIDIRPNGSIKIAEDQTEIEGGWHWKKCNFTK